jgi:ribonuclease T2
VRRALAAAGAAVLAIQAAPALAQREGGTPGSFDFYVLALSWSPGFCALEGDRKAREQCAPGSGLGFTVHGLWPQNERGFPSECGGDRSPSRLALEEARGVFPSEGLARYQWRKHGTCSGLSPADYYRAARRARDAVAIPERFKGQTAGGVARAADIERAFSEANPGLRPDMMAVSCSRGEFQEVRICFERDLRGFRRCPEVDRRGCGFGELRIGAPR